MTAKKRKKPNIVIDQADFDRLTVLAENAAPQFAEVAEELLGELDRAKVVASNRFPANAVRMGSSVVYRANDGSERRVTLVYPGEADIALGRVSILTPIGTALIGLAPEQSISWVARDGKAHELVVVSVSQEADATVTDSVAS